MNSTWRPVVGAPAFDVDRCIDCDWKMGACLFAPLRLCWQCLVRRLQGWRLVLPGRRALE